MQRLPCSIVCWWSLILVAAFLWGCPAGDDDDSAEQACAAAETDWEVDPDGEDGQIHPKTRLVDGQLWTAYNRPDGTNNFAVFVVVRECDGTLVSGPTRLDAGDGNATDPDIAASNGRVLVAWQTDDGGDPNLSVRTALLDADGALIASDTRLAMTDGGAAWVGQSWMAHLTDTADGWAMALVRADDGAQFHVAVQALDADGLATGDALRLTDGIDAAFEPALMRDGDELVVGWQRSFDGSQGFGLARVANGAAAAMTWGVLDATGAGIGLGRDGDGRLFGAVGNAGARILFGRLGDDGAEPSGGSGVHSGPSIAPDVSGGVVAWNEGGANNAALVARRFDGDGALVSDRVEIASGLGAYITDVVALPGGFVAATVADGPSPTFRLRTVVLELP